MTKIIIGSKLPNGLLLRHPLEPTTTVEIKGLNSAPAGVNGARVILPYVTTEVDADFWQSWKVVHDHKTKPFQPLASGAIFEAKSYEAAKSIAKEQSARRTELEPMKQTGDSRMGQKEALALKPDKD